MTNANIMRVRSSWNTRMLHKDLVPEWQDFNAFLSWAEENGYGAGSVIRKINNNMPAGPCNCYIYSLDKEVVVGKKQQHIPIDAIEKWDRTVAMLRCNLEKASIIQEATLIHRIRSGLMPREWYTPKS